MLRSNEATSDERRARANAHLKTPSLARQGAVFRHSRSHRSNCVSHFYHLDARHSRNAFANLLENPSNQFNSSISRRSSATPLAAPLPPRRFSSSPVARPDVVAMAKGKGGKRAQQMMSQAPVSGREREERRREEKKREKKKKRESTKRSSFFFSLTTSTSKPLNLSKTSTQNPPVPSRPTDRPGQRGVCALHPREKG